MEQVVVKLGDDARFDQCCHGGLPEGGDLEIVTKDRGTIQGRAIALLTFTVRLPDWTAARAQSATTVRNLMMALAALRGRYGDDGIFPGNN